MAVNDFWRALAGELTFAEREAGMEISPILFFGFAFDVAMVGATGLTLAQARTSFNCTSGDRLTELNDLASSIATIAVANRHLRALVVLDLVAGGIVGMRSTKLPGNPLAGAGSGNKLRLRIKEMVTLMGGTPQGTLAAA
jgi:hypothetical protein